MNNVKRDGGNLLIRLVTVYIFAMVAACITVLLTGHKILFLAFAAVTVFLFICSYVLIRRTGNVVAGFYRSVVQKLTVPNSDIYNHFSLPVIILQDNRVMWYNSLFRTNVLKGDDIAGEMSPEILSPVAQSALQIGGKVDIEIKNKKYTIYASSYVERDKTNTVLYFLDLTDLKNIQKEFEETRPVVAILSIDSYEEITADMAESDQADLKGAIDREIERFTSEISGLTKKLKNNRYISVFDERSLVKLKAGKIEVLDKVRNLEFGSRAKTTLSIGIGRGEPTIKQCEILALQALQMSQGRGGDQAAIKTGDSYEFFGGISHSGIEKRTKVKTRVVASALKELIRGSDCVFLMGHKYGDIDSLGASYGLWKCAVAIGKESYIVADEHTHLASSLLKKIKEEAGDNVIVDEAFALERITRQSLLIICDTLRRDFVDFSSVYDACQTSVVIDHHRKNIDFIDNSVIFYHEPYASSACEMVSELIQYIDGSLLERSQANALLAGIMLDTRNFVLRTGVRTFETSAFLRSKGADPVAVKHLFADSISILKERSMLVSRAEFLYNAAIATADETESVSRIAASQAADELLNIENVDVSFVLFKTEHGINISARSLGKVNVQIIMEALGGGGHHTMAATQIPDVSVNEAKKRLTQILKQSTRKDDSNEGNFNI